MNPAGADPLSRLRIPPGKRRSRWAAGWLPLLLVALVILSLLGILWMHPPSSSPGSPASAATSPPAQTNPVPPSESSPSPPNVSVGPEVLLTASGYIVPRERIELSAKFPGTVASVRVAKGDQVKKGDVLVTLVDDEYRLQLKEARGRLALAKANLSHAQATHKRQQELIHSHAATDQSLDDAQRALATAQAEVLIAEAQVELASTKLAWCTTYAPADGTVLECMVDENELIIPQAFGMAPDAPSPTLLAMANLNELRVEVDVNELEIPKVRLRQTCRITPVAYPDKSYTGYVAEISPEADRQKGTLQIEVAIQNPDRFLVPEMNAKVDFLAE